ncbi:trans-sulfuration enzyme family protein [Methylocella sp.]|uniref:trans-sulfuration enzyme family protein n=1 Tax=Methylocella sp. TaxID=1978226 RepID=UPI003782F292
MTETPKLSDAALALHAGDKDRALGAPLSPPIVLSSNFYSHPDAIGFSANELQADAPHFYARWSNPTVDLLERRLAALEGAEAGLCFASGMAALAALFFGVLRPGDELLISDVCYAGTAELAFGALAARGVGVKSFDASDLGALERALSPATRLIHIETPANPILRVHDIEAIAGLARASGAELSVDSTIATPIATKPLALGADYVVHSLTKYLCGHGDALGGAILGRAAPLAELRAGELIHFGGALAPFPAFLILRGLETLGLRMARHEANARALEDFLAGHAKVRRTLWPGSPRHPQHALAKRQMRNFSGLFSFSAKEGSAALARRVAETVRLFSYAVSLGKSKSLIYYIPTDALLRNSLRLDAAAEASYRDWAGEGVFRVSPGLEEADELIADLDRALA